MKKYVCPQCGETVGELCGPINPMDLDLEYEDSAHRYFECPECGYRSTEEDWIDFRAANL